MSSIPEDVYLLICQHATPSTIAAMTATCRQWYRYSNQNKTRETSFLRGRGYSSVRHFREVHGISDPTTCISDIRKKIKDPSKRTPHDAIFFSIFYRLAESLQSSSKAAAALQNGRWLLPHGYTAPAPTKKESAWFKHLQAAHPEQLLNAVECYGEWDDIFA